MSNFAIRSFNLILHVSDEKVLVERVDVGDLLQVTPFALRLLAIRQSL